MEWLSSQLPNFFGGLTAVGLIGGLFAFLKLAIEYSRDNRRKRMELYLRLRDEFRTNERFSDIFKFLDNYADASDTNKRKLAGTFRVSLDTRAEFASFLEDVAMCVSSGEMKPDVAHYMFGYYAICCWENKVFWKGLDQDSIYWAMLKGFVEEMKAQRDILKDTHQELFGRLRWFGPPLATRRRGVAVRVCPRALR
jgi:hypothetical protein